MTLEEVGLVLAAAAARDARTVGAADILAWHQDIGDLDVQDAIDAVSRHYRTSTDRLMPAHVRRIVAETDRDRRRLQREAAERRALAELEADPTRRDRSEDVERLLADLRDRLPSGDPDKLRRPEVLEWERARDRAATAEPNPHYNPAAVRGLIASSSLGTPDAAAARGSVTAAGELTGMPAEQADWEAA